ncbi:uncharacterized protein LOC131957386 isoform X2 [Physella acuta]|uniref:uncharacterized protein LOC131957386 isoform X2 n=1 Tax=Physella acuta TaxID=109671 RepID=UPI0027DDB0CE|nr:uncharacterized protein LOC131957386 isoform X2 [Physella acuta]XP_059178153.1 uncharacterized protein LOC131957386 isoform X2 [Physella acuta]
MDNFDSNPLDYDMEGSEQETPAARAKRLRTIAKCRRDTENQILTELTDLLPLGKDVLAKQDKSSLLRLVLSYMRFREAFSSGVDDIDENSQDDVTWSKSQRLVPVSCSLSPMLPLKDDQRQTDMELDDPFIGMAGYIGSPKRCKKRNFYVADSSGDASLLGQLLKHSGPRPSGQADNGMRPTGQVDHVARPTGQTDHGVRPTGLADLEQQASLDFEDLMDYSCAVTPARQQLSHTGSLCQIISDCQKLRLSDEGQLMLDAAQGFLMIIDKELRILFVSENVSEHLGHQQTNMLGLSIAEFVHPKDMNDIIDHMKDEQFQSGNDGTSPVWLTRRMFYVGMKFCFQKPGSRNKDTGYTLVQWNAKLRLKRSKKGQDVYVKSLLALCRPVRTDSVLEIRMDGNMFISRHDLSFHFIYCDPRIINLIGYEPSDLLGRTAYQFHCPKDVLVCKDCHTSLILSGASKSDYYRFLSKSGKWVWLSTHATIVYDTAKNPQYVVCKNYIISQEEAERKLSQEQKDFEAMKCLGFSLETDLPIVEYMSSSRLASSRQTDEDNTIMLDQLLHSEKVDVSSNPYARPRKKRNISSGLNMGIPRSSSSSGLYIQALNQVATVNSKDNVPTVGQAAEPVDMADPAGQLFDLTLTSNSFDPVLADMSEPQLTTADLFTSQDHWFSPDLTNGFFSQGLAEKENILTFTEGCTGLSSVEAMEQSLSKTELLGKPVASNRSQLSPSKTNMRSTANTFPRLQEVSQPALTTQQPVLTTQQPVLTTQQPALVTQQPALVTQQPALTTVHGQAADNELAPSKLYSLLKTGANPKVMPSSQKIIICKSQDESHAPRTNTVSILRNALFSCHPNVPAVGCQKPELDTPPLSSTYPGSCGKSDPPPGKKEKTNLKYNGLQSQYLTAANTDSSSFMTDGNCDPFLSQLMDTNLFQDSYMIDSPADGSSHTPYVHHNNTMDQTGKSLHTSLMDDASVTLGEAAFSAENLRELDSFLSIIPASPVSLDQLSSNLDSENFSDSFGLCSDQEVSQSSVTSAVVTTLSNSGSSESSDNETTNGRPSLLRTLLDKEGEAIQGPLTYTEWILEEALKKKNELKRSKMARNNFKISGQMRARYSKHGARKSTELPLPKSGVSFNYAHSGTQMRKPTKELPLPLSAMSASSCTMSDRQTGSSIGANRNQRAPSSDSCDSFSLPDDLLDLAVEYCGSLGADQAEALISDLAENSTFEDNLYSMIASPAQAKTSTVPGSRPAASQMSASCDVPMVSDSRPVSDKPAARQIHITVLDKTPQDCANSLLPSPIKIDVRIARPNSAGDSGKMSLLRAAVTSPDVDKLIEQIPLRKSPPNSSLMRNFQQLPQSQLPQEESDILITKVSGLQKDTYEQSTQMVHGRVFKVPASAAIKANGKLSPSKSVYSPTSSMSASEHMDAILFDHFYTASLSMNSPNQSHASPVHTTGPKASISCSNKSKLSPTSPRPTTHRLTSPGSPRASGITNSDLSSIQPVSVMIMKKENHRSRRSKSIGLQTDNEPGEVYPEFERSPTDTILYPSSCQVSQCLTHSPSSQTSHGSTPLSSSPNMSELEKFLRGFSGAEDSVSSVDEEGRCRSETPFLQRLLTGELSQDNYQRLDQQLLERERRESLSSGSEQDYL